MIEVVKNETAFSAVCEYYLVDKFGKHQEKGDYLYIADLQIAEKYRRKRIIKKLIKQFLEKNPQLRYCYFERKKYGDKMYFHSRRIYERLIKEEKNVEMA